MAEAAPQNYENHAVMPVRLLVVAVVFLAAAILATAGLLMPGTTAGHCLVGTALIVHALAGVYGLLLMRHYATRLQDRIIRTEMRLRLAEVLPDDLREPARNLSIPKLVALRFAADDELPDLVRKVLDEHIEQADDIKKLVTKWQADHCRV